MVSDLNDLVIHKYILFMTTVHLNFRLKTRDHAICSKANAGVCMNEQHLQWFSYYGRAYMYVISRLEYVLFGRLGLLMVVTLVYSMDSHWET